MNMRRGARLSESVTDVRGLSVRSDVLRLLIVKLRRVRHETSITDKVGQAISGMGGFGGGGVGLYIANGGL